MRRFVIGDIHGEHDKLVRLLKKVNFDYNNDSLISLGDVVDRGPKSYEVIEELLKIKNFICVKGNHDSCFEESVRTGKVNMLYDQGGRETLLFYTRSTDCSGDPRRIPQSHIDFFDNQLLYYVDKDNNLFVHGGFDRHRYIEGQPANVLMWDRDLFLAALSYESMNDKTHDFKMKDSFNKIYVGHTPTIYWDSITPIKAANIINIDTGCGKGDFPLTIMNIDDDTFEQVI